MTAISKEVQQVLSSVPNAMDFEPIASEDASPLNAPVIEKDIAVPNTTESPNAHEAFEQIPEQEMDAPEQHIDDSMLDMEDDDVSDDETYELPTAHAKQAADTFLGMADNFIEIGGGFFIKVKKHDEFYDFDEVVQVIDEHNAKNVKRLKLEKEDKALLKPLLVEVLKKKAQKLTPEQQLIGALVSILIKKAQIVMEIRAENELLLGRIIDIIREEKGGTAESDETPEEEPIIPESVHVVEEVPTYEMTEPLGQDGFTEATLEVADTDKNKKDTNG